MPILQNRTLVTIAIGLCAILATGCAAMRPAMEPPRVSLASIRVQEIRGLETSFEVDLRVLNRSERILTITGLDCELSLGGRQLAQGVANPAMEIAPYESSVLSVVVYSSMLDMVGVARRLLRGVSPNAGNEKLPYAVSGHLVAGSGGYADRIPYELKGEIDLQELTGGV